MNELLLLYYVGDYFSPTLFSKFAKRMKGKNIEHREFGKLVEEATRDYKALVKDFGSLYEFLLAWYS